MAALGRYGTCMIRLLRSDDFVWVSIRLLIIVVTSLAVVAGVLLLGRPCTFIGKYVDPMLAGILTLILLTAAFICLRGRPWWANSRVSLVTAAIALWLLFMLMPNIHPVPQRAKAAVAMAQMREIGRQIEAGVTPYQSLDSWCHPYEIESSPKGYVVISYGQGGDRTSPQASLILREQRVRMKTTSCSRPAISSDIPRSWSHERPNPPLSPSVPRNAPAG